jgi:hypothetical protein
MNSCLCCVDCDMMNVFFIIMGSSKAGYLLMYMTGWY